MDVFLRNGHIHSKRHSPPVQAPIEICFSDKIFLLDSGRVIITYRKSFFPKFVRRNYELQVCF